MRNNFLKWWHFNFLYDYMTEESVMHRAWQSVVQAEGIAKLAHRSWEENRCMSEEKDHCGYSMVGKRENDRRWDQ